MGPVFLSGERINLRPLRFDDFDRCWTWINDPRVRRHLLAIRPYNEAREREWVQQKGDDQSVVLAIEKKDGVHIGNIGLHKIDHRVGIGEIGIVVGEVTEWSRGYGEEATRMIIKYAFETLNLRKLRWRANAPNKASIACAKKCGFRIEAVLREEWYVDGRYTDIVSLALFCKSGKRRTTR